MKILPRPAIYNIQSTVGVSQLVAWSCWQFQFEFQKEVGHISVQILHHSYRAGGQPCLWSPETHPLLSQLNWVDSCKWGMQLRLPSSLSRFSLQDQLSSGEKIRKSPRFPLIPCHLSQGMWTVSSQRVFMVATFSDFLSKLKPPIAIALGVYLV